MSEDTQFVRALLNHKSSKKEIMNASIILDIGLFPKKIDFLSSYKTAIFQRVNV